jgi:hypothetical protein
MTEPGTARQRDVWVALGMAVAATSAAVSSFSGLRSLAEVAGWVPAMAWLFPLTVDAYAMTATRVWLVGSARSQRAQRFARANAVGAILMSLTGNAIYHLIAVGLVATNWVVVVAVGAVPPLVLGLVSHLAVLRTQVDGPGVLDRLQTSGVPVAVPVTVSPAAVRSPVAPVRPPSLSPSQESGDGPRTREADDLWEMARAADAAYRSTHAARPITRDALRQALHISGARATELVRRLKDERPQPAAVNLAED